MLLAAIFMAGRPSPPTATPAHTPTPPGPSFLHRVRPDELELMVKRCDEAIEQTPDQADLHRARALVLTLLGDQPKTCDDVATAVSLLKRSSQPVDPMLQHELQVRQSNCKQSRTMAGSD